MLQATGATVRIGSSVILQDASIAVGSGEIVAIVGPNGAGKSTFLTILSGFRRPNQGQVFLQKRPLAEWPRKELARRRAVLAQKIELSLPFSALEVVLMGRAPHRGKTRRDEDIALAMMAMRASGTADFAERPYTTLSGGEQQRVHLARVIAQIWQPRRPLAGEERYLLLDEPTSSLDLAHQHATLRIARQLAADGVGVVAVLHDLNLAAMYADRLYLMKSGSVIAHGLPGEVLLEPVLEDVFGLKMTVTGHPSRDCLHVLAT